MSKLKIAIINELGDHVVIESHHVPRIGDSVGLFYKPAPKVTNVLWYSKEIDDVDVIITVS